jgi:hypothetical protein
VSIEMRDMLILGGVWFLVVHEIYKAEVKSIEECDGGSDRNVLKEIQRNIRKIEDQ